LRAERARLAAALADRSAQLEAITQEFEQFTQTVSHDLRAPLRALEGFAQILLEDYRDKLDVDGNKCLETLVSSSHKASMLLEDLHMYARLCKKPFAPAVIDMAKLAAQKVEDLKTEGAAAKFSIDSLPAAWGDPEMLDIILGHLLGNAVKFANRQKNPTVEVTGRRENGRTVFAVRDNGVGFDPKHAGRLFGVFQRLHDEKEFPGRGIGLAMVQRLVHRHGGRVWAEGKVNAGATFTFALPVQPL
jgi:light-regulated signal transduction histidine kinase (bacteriophytochrome)